VNDAGPAADVIDTVTVGPEGPGVDVLGAAGLDDPPQLHINNAPPRAKAVPESNETRMLSSSRDC
jgi:hypothetical protein